MPISTPIRNGNDNQNTNNNIVSPNKGSKLAEALQTSPPRNNLSPIQNQRRVQRQPHFSRRELTAILRNRFIQDAGAYNLHHTVLHNLLGLTCVPYASVDLAQDCYNIPAAYHQRHAPQPTFAIRTLFVGRISLVARPEVIAYMIKMITGRVPTRIYICSSSSTNRDGKVTSPLVQVDVHEEDAAKVIASIHRRVMIDQTAFYVATTKEQILAVHRYGKMLDANSKIRYNHRPRSVVTVVAQRIGGAAGAASTAATAESILRETRNIYSPLCDCRCCRAMLEHCSDYSYLFQTLLPAVTYTTDADIQSLIDSSNNNNNNGDLSSLLESSAHPKFDLDAMMRTPSFLKPEELMNPIERKVYCDVSAAALRSCREHCTNYWPFWADCETDAQDLHCCNRDNQM